jgi:hypothetical protein
VPESVRGFGGADLASKYCGGVRDEGGESGEGSPRRRMLKMECLRDCGWGSVEALASLDTRGGGGSVTSAVPEKARTDDAAIWGFVGTSCEDPGDDDDASGLAMRRPPND